MAKYVHDNRSAQIEDEHESGAHDGENYGGWYCGFCEDAIDFAVDMLMADREH